MEYLILLLPIIAFAIFHIINRYVLKKHKKKTSTNILKYPTYYAVFMAVGFICTLALGLWAFIAQNLLAVLLSFGVISLLFLLGFYYLLRYRVKIFEDKVEVRSLCKTQEFNFIDVIIYSERSIQIFNLHGKEIKRITGFLDTNDDLYKAYNLFYKKRKIKKPTPSINEKISCNGYVLGFGLVILLCGTAMLAVCIVAIIIETLTTQDLIFWIVALIIGILATLVGTTMVLSFINWKIEYIDGKLVKRNLVRRKRIFNCADLEATETDILYKIRNINGKMISFVFVYLTNNSDLIIDWIDNIQ